MGPIVVPFTITSQEELRPKQGQIGRHLVASCCAFGIGASRVCRGFNVIAGCLGASRVCNCFDVITGCFSARVGCQGGDVSFGLLNVVLIGADTSIRLVNSVIDSCGLYCSHSDGGSRLKYKQLIFCEEEHFQSTNSLSCCVIRKVLISFMFYTSSKVQQKSLVSIVSKVLPILAM